MEVFRPRYYHLLAYNRAIFGQYNKAKRNLRKAVKLANEMMYSLEVEWAEHSYEVWNSFNTIEMQASFWQVDKEEHNKNWNKEDILKESRIMYSLPLPHWLKT